MSTPPISPPTYTSPAAPGLLPWSNPGESEVAQGLNGAMYEESWWATDFLILLLLQRVGGLHDTLADHQSHSNQQLPMASVISQYHADWEISGGLQDCSSSFASFTTHTSANQHLDLSSSKGFVWSTKCGWTWWIHHPTLNGCRTRCHERRRPTLKSQWSYILKKSATPWPASNQKQSIIIECFSWENAHMRDSGTQSTEDTFDIRNQVAFITLYLIMFTQQLDWMCWFQFPWRVEVVDCWTHWRILAD